MRRCYRGVALVLGVILLASNSLSNSCSFMTLNAYAAEAAHSDDSVTVNSFEYLSEEDTESVTITRRVRVSENVTVTETVKGADNYMHDKFTEQNDIQTGEENVETEIPADEPDPTSVVEEGTKKKNIYLKLKEYNVLLRIVEAEAGGEDITGKMLVANVIMNRVKHHRFPDTVTEVVYQKNRTGRAQFSPIVDGRFDSVTVSQETVDAVERVLNGEDSSNGALYFRSVHSTSDWHDSSLNKIMEHGNHIFYTI